MFVGNKMIQDHPAQFFTNRFGRFLFPMFFRDFLDPIQIKHIVHMLKMINGAAGNGNLKLEGDRIQSFKFQVEGF